MLSKSYKCIFIRISKVASKSVVNAFLSDKKGRDTEYFAWRHHDITFYQETYPKVFDGYFKFAFVRNPWGRIYSQYKYFKNIKKMEIAQYGFERYLSLCEESLNNGNFLFGRNREIFVRHMTNQLEWLTIDDKLQVDFIGRFENIEKDFQFVSQRLNVNLILPHVNKSSNKQEDYRLAYNEQMLEQVAKWHSKDISYFNYKF